MSKVFVNIGLSLDGYMAPEGMTMENPGYKNWGAKWGALMAWLLNQQYMRENLKFGPGGETGPVNDLVRSTTERIGANIMGKRMFEPCLSGCLTIAFRPRWVRSLPRIKLRVSRWNCACGEAQHGIEGRHRIEASVEAKYVFVQVRL